MRERDGNVPFVLRPEHISAIEAIKALLTSECTLSYYDPAREMELVVEASPVGVAAILTQKDEHSAIKVLSYMSHTLTDTEQCYPQVHHEALAVTWGILLFSIYLRSNARFTIVNDNATVVHIFNNPASCPPPRIEC